MDTDVFHQFRTISRSERKIMVGSESVPKFIGHRISIKVFLSVFKCKKDNYNIPHVITLVTLSDPSEDRHYMDLVFGIVISKMMFLYFNPLS